ncbi:MAG TPA: SurA N-terminal domain-containing protein [Acidobacteriota bacterium]|nr:SurA N-terminal domain-containing protein [Acidobacteriota bacterium]
MKVKAFIFYAAALLILGAIFAWVILNAQRNIDSGGENLYPSMVVARVDGIEILAEQVNKRVNLGNQVEIPDRAEQRRLQNQALDQLIFRQLIINDGKRRGIEIGSAELDEQLQQYLEMSGGEELVSEQLKQSNQTMDDLREDVRLRMLFEKVRMSVEPELGGSIKVDESEIDAFYKENLDNRYTKMEIAYIYVEIRETSEELKARAFEVAQEILAKLAEGASFDAIVADQQQIEGLRVSKGKFEETDQVSDILRLPALKLEVGEHTKKPIEFINSGFQILKCLSKRVVPLAEVRESIGQRLRGVKLNAALSDYFNGLRDKADIEILLK